ncbi:MAG TPA: methyltransferase [Polyangiaceae bacterium]
MKPSPLALGRETFPDAPPALGIRVVLGVRAFLLRLADRLCPAHVVVFQRATGIMQTAMLGAICAHDIPDLLEARGPLDAGAIAEARSLDADAVHRTLRALANTGIFAMRSDGTFENNRLSRALTSGKLVRSREWALYFASRSNAHAWVDYARTLETGRSAFARVHGKSVWQWFDEHEDEREMFAHCMMGITVQDAPVVAKLYPFSEVKRLCDVGGGRGTLLSEIVIRHPNVRGVLCDGDGVIASARELLEARGVLDRVELAPGSFFDEVPSGCDAYMMKNILHDWDDATSTRILKVVRRAMQPGQRIILVEMIVDRLARDVVGTQVDLQMMIACDEGRERSVDELAKLFAASGFRFTRVFPFPTVSIIEGEAT